MPYLGRPGVSPPVALLLASGQLRRDHRVLDVGCGDGTEALLLAEWGVRRIVAIDEDAHMLALAGRRARRRGLADRVEFRHLGAEGLGEAFPPRTFDVVLHTLVANNLPRTTAPHFRNLARVMRPRGLLVLQERVPRGEENKPPGRVAPLAGLRRHFRLSPGVATHLPESRQGPRHPGYARVVLWLGRPR